MRLDEMIIKANADGKMYFCNGTNLEYSKEKGFLEYLDGSPTELTPSKYRVAVFINGWQEKPIRHLTVSEAEKELDCVIDAPELLKPINEPPSNYRTVIVFYRDFSFTQGYYSREWNHFIKDNWSICKDAVYWCDPADLKKLLPKE